MGEEKVSLELLGTRFLGLTAGVRDLQHRFTAVESRFSALENRVSALEIAMTAGLDGMSTRLDTIERRFAIPKERLSAMLAVIVRVAGRLEGTQLPPPT